MTSGERDGEGSNCKFNTLSRGCLLPYQEDLGKLSRGDGWYTRTGVHRSSPKVSSRTELVSQLVGLGVAAGGEAVQRSAEPHLAHA